MRSSLLRIVLVGFLAFVWFFSGAETAHAQPVTPCSSVTLPFTGTCSGSATQYLFTLLSFRLRPQGSDGSQDVALISNASQQAFDAAAVSAGGQVGVWATGLFIPQGTYTPIILEINRTFTASGTVTLPVGDGRSCTATNAQTTIDIPSSGEGNTFTDLGGGNMSIAVTVSGLTIPAGGVTIDFSIKVDVGTGVEATFPAFPGVCTSTAAGRLSLSMSFTCVSGACPAAPAQQQP